MSKPLAPHQRAVEVARAIVDAEREIAQLEARIVAARNDAAPPKQLIDLRRQLADARAELEELGLQLAHWRQESAKDAARVRALQAREHIDDAFERIDRWADEVRELEARGREWATAYMQLRGTREAVIGSLKRAGVDQRVLGLVIDESAVDAHVGNALLALKGVSWYRGGDSVNRNVSGEDALRRHAETLGIWLQPLLDELDAAEKAANILSADEVSP